MRALILTLISLILLLTVQVQAAINFNATDVYIDTGSAVAYGSAVYPVSICAWFKPGSIGTDMTIAALGRGSGGDLSAFRLYLRSTGAVRAQPADSAGASQSATSSGTVTAGQWAHACAVFEANNSRRVYLNGAVNNGNTVPNTVSAMQNTSIGVEIINGSSAEYFDGDICEVSYWTVALSNDQVAAMAKGWTAPNLINNAGLADYLPMVTAPATITSYRGRSFTVHNTPANANHKPVINTF